MNFKFIAMLQLAMLGFFFVGDYLTLPTFLLWASSSSVLLFCSYETLRLRKFLLSSASVHANFMNILDEHKEILADINQTQANFAYDILHLELEVKALTNPDDAEAMRIPVRSTRSANE